MWPCLCGPSVAQKDKSLPSRSAAVAGSPKAARAWERTDVRRKLFKSGKSIVMALPTSFLRVLNLEQGSEVCVTLDKEREVIVVAPAMKALPDVDADFARQVGEIIEEYRPALEALAAERRSES